MNSYKIKFTLSILVALLIPSWAWGFEPGNIRLGRVEIHPGYSLQSRFDDNIFLEADDKFADGTSEGRSEDTIITNIPTMNFLLDRKPGDLFGFDVTYTGTDEHFMDLNEQDKFNHDINGSVEMGGFGGRSVFTVSGQYLDTQLPASSEFASNLTPILSRLFTKVKGEADWTFSKRLEANTYAGTEANDYDLKSLSFQDTEEFSAGANAFYKITPLTAVGLKYDFRHIDYDNPGTINSDSDSNSVQVAVKWDPTALISGEVSVGYQDRSYDAFSGQDREDAIYGISLTYKPTKRSTFILTGDRAIQDSSFGVIQAYVSTNLGLAWNQKLGRKFRVESSFNYTNADYELPATDGPGNGLVRFREDDLVSFEVAVIYDIQKWLDARLEYLYRENHTNFSANQYANDRVQLTVGAHF